jgi:hypothetical protein
MSHILGILSRMAAKSHAPDMTATDVDQGAGHADDHTVNDQVDADAYAQSSDTPEAQPTNDNTVNDQVDAGAYDPDANSDDLSIEDQPYAETRASDTPNAVDLILHLPTQNLYRASDIVVRLYIDGERIAHRLIDRESPNATEIFTIPLQEPCASKGEIQINFGKAHHPTPREFARLKGVEPHEFSCPLINHNPQEEDRVGHNGTIEQSQARDAKQQVSQEQFYDALSQLTVTEDISTAAHRSTAGDHPMIESEPAVENQHVATNSPTREDTSVATSATEDELARSSRATREIFIETSPIFEESPQSPAAASSSPTVTPALSDLGPDTELLDDLHSNTEKSEVNDIISRGETPEQSSGTIDKYLSSKKTAGQFGIHDPSIDSDDEASHLISNAKPLKRTSYVSSGAANKPGGSTKTNQETPAGKHDSAPDKKDIRPQAPLSKPDRDPVA